MIWIIGGIAVVVVGLLVLRGGVYRELFSDAHFEEVARAVPALKAQQPVVTSAGLAIFYTARPDGDRWVHHVSVSVKGGHTAGAVGRRFAPLLVKLLGWPKAAFGIAASTVHHAECILGAEEHAQVLASTPPALNAQQLRELAEAAMKLSQWVRINAPTTDA